MRKKEPAVSPAAGCKRAVWPRASRFSRATQYPPAFLSLLNSLPSSWDPSDVENYFAR